MSYLVGTNCETWTRFHVLQFDDESTPKPNGMKMWSELHRKLKDDFTCIPRADGTILVDAKTKTNSEELENINQLCNNNVTISRDLRMNSTMATVLVP